MLNVLLKSLKKSWNPHCLLIENYLLEEINMRIFRIVFSYSSSHHKNRVLIRVCSKNYQVFYFSNLQMKYLHYANNSNTYSSNSFKPAFQVFNRYFQVFNRYICSAFSKEIDSLSKFIMSKNNEQFEIETTEELNKILNFLLAKGYKSTDIKKTFLPYLNSVYSSYVKFSLLADIHTDIHLLLPLLLLSPSILKSAARQFRNDEIYMKDFPDRISYLCCHLELIPEELIPILVKHSALLTMNFKRLDHKMRILKNANISSKYIVKDLWIFNYNENLLAKRIQSAQKADVELKPWMLRCSEKFFESMLMKSAETLRILDGESVTNYLAKKLECNTDYVKYMMDKNKLLKSINIPKLEQIINFLFQKGYTPHEIRLFPRVFCSKVETLEKRFDGYTNVKCTLPTISQLCTSSKKFENNLRKIS